MDDAEQIHFERRGTLFFTAEEERRIAEAIADAERSTSGEIVAVIASESDSYLYAPFLWASLIALLVPWPFIHFTWWSVHWIYALQLLVFVALVAIMLPQPVRRWLVPRRVQRLRAHRRAVEQFLVQNLHTTSGRTGVLIFVSVAERYAEVLADVGIDTKVPPGTWQGIVDDLTAKISAGQSADGFVAAITTAGQHLATHFPPGKLDPNQLPNHLIVLD